MPTAGRPICSRGCRAMIESETPLVEVPRGPQNPLLTMLGLLVYAFAGALTALWEILLVPLRYNTHLLWVSVPLAVATNIALPWLARMVNDTNWAGFVPVLTWTITVVYLLGSRPEGDVLVTAVPSDLKYVAYAMFFAGVISAVTFMARLSMRRRLPIATASVERSGSGIGGVR